MESHSIPGGAAHAWVQDGYHFESGPSLYSGMAAKCGPLLMVDLQPFIVCEQRPCGADSRTVAQES